MNAVKQGNAVQESNAYNHRGERVLRTPAGGTAQITLYDEAGQWLGNYSATGQAQQQAIWLDNYPVALINVPLPACRSWPTCSRIIWALRVS